MTSEVFLAQFRAWTARDAPHRLRPSRHRRMHAGLGHAAVAVDAQPPAERHRPRRRQALSRPAPGRDLRRWPTRSAGCSPRAARFSTCSNSKPRGAGDAVARRRPAPAPCSSSATSATCRPRRPPAKSARICAELVFGYNRHPSWDDAGAASCFFASELEEFEETMPGITAMARRCARRPTAAIPQKAGPCAGCAGDSEFLRLQSKLTHLPQRLAPGQGPRRRNREQGHDSRSAGLPGSEAA